MTVQIKRHEPTAEPPIEVVTLQGPSGRCVVVRPNSGDLEGSQPKRTIELREAGNFVCSKWTVMMGDLRAFGQALLDIADGK